MDRILILMSIRPWKASNKPLASYGRKIKTYTLRNRNRTYSAFFDIILMKKNIYLLTIFIIFLSSITSVLLLFFYMNLENNMTVGLTIMGIACFLAGSSFFALTLYLFKKLYYRGDVYISTVHSSLRQ